MVLCEIWHRAAVWMTLLSRRLPRRVQAVALHSAAAGLDGSGAVGHRITRFAGEPLRVAGLSQNLRSLRPLRSLEISVRVVSDAVTASLISPSRALISRFKPRIRVTRDRAMRALGLMSPLSSLEALFRPLALVSDLSPLWYPQRIFIRSLCRRLTVVVRSLTSSCR